MDLKNKKCEKCGSEDIFKQKLEKQDEDQVRCMLCGLVGPIEEFVDKEQEKEGK